MSDAVKSVEGSEREKEMDAVSPAASEEASEEMEMEGGRVSMVRARRYRDQRHRCWDCLRDLKMRHCQPRSVRGNGINIGRKGGG